MFTIINSETAELVIKKSKFISYVFYIKNLAEFDDFYKKMKNEHKKATHICYAYKVANQVKYFDDGEPSKTAGMPIMNVIEKNDLTNVVIFVVRYFGGTLLGSGGLTRAYSSSAVEVINKAKKVKMKSMLEIEVEITYEIYDIFLNYLRIEQHEGINTTFNDKIVVKFLTTLDFKDDLESMFYPNLKVKSRIKKDVIDEAA